MMAGESAGAVKQLATIFNRAPVSHREPLHVGVVGGQVAHRQPRRGLATLCVGGGMGCAMVVERP